MAKKQKLISINDALAQGIDRLRQPQWAHQLDHLNIKPYGTPGIWTHLYCPFNKECNGRDPVEVLIFQHDQDAKQWMPYTGALPDSDEYRAAVAIFDGCITEREKATTLDSVQKRLKSGTHVLMPVKPTAEMRAAIEGYYFSIIGNRGAEKKDGARRDRVFAQCWKAMMAYLAMVELFKCKRP